jgi:predicted transcriptional regulator
MCTNDAFKSALTQLRMSEQEIADLLHVSRPTVSRWIRGKNLPHQALRAPIVELILKSTGRQSGGAD